jgi:RNA polymerase sigma-54 factor
MALSQRLVMKQGQSLVMTPQLQQAIKLLQMSSIELQAFVEAEIERNPLLDHGDGGSEKVAVTATDTLPDSLEQSFATPGSGGPGEVEAQSSAPASSSDGQAMMATDAGWSNLRSSGHLSLDGDESDYASSLSQEESLSEYLTNQLNLNFSNQTDLLIGQNIIGMVNEIGYVTGDPLALAESLGAPQERVQAVFDVMRTFDPAGVFALDLADCLRMQLKERNRLDPAMAALLDHLPMVAKRDFVALRNVCQVSQEDLQDMLVELRALNPKPGHAFGSEPVSPVVPDVFVRAAPDGTWMVELNSETLPRVLVNNQYMAKVASNTSREEDKMFLAGCHAQAAWLVKSLDQRAKTVLKVAREIVSQQDAFLVHGIAQLKPITLKTVADAISMHESTVSRVTSNKYMATPRGTFELKYFFTNAIATTNGLGDAHSAESVRYRIKDLIAAETADHIFSDDEIVATLKQEGVDIARRTVAKYRESLNILSSVQRRREARLKG